MDKSSLANMLAFGFGIIPAQHEYGSLIVAMKLETFVSYLKMAKDLEPDVNFEFDEKTDAKICVSPLSQKKNYIYMKKKNNFYFDCFFYSGKKNQTAL